MVKEENASATAGEEEMDEDDREDAENGKCCEMNENEVEEETDEEEIEKEE